jgi:hypothetical protein
MGPARRMSGPPNRSGDPFGHVQLHVSKGKTWLQKTGGQSALVGAHLWAMRLLSGTEVTRPGYRRIANALHVTSLLRYGASEVRQLGCPASVTSFFLEFDPGRSLP